MLDIRHILQYAPLLLWRQIGRDLEYVEAAQALRIDQRDVDIYHGVHGADTFVGAVDVPCLLGVEYAGDIALRQCVEQPSDRCRIERVAVYRAAVDRAQTAVHIYVTVESLVAEIVYTQRVPARCDE